jgi:Gas vesicle synthesis protein GvpL/GvpF
LGVIYAYGICEPVIRAPTLRRRGLGGAALRALEREGLAAIYSRHRSLRPRPEPKLVLDHERVVEAIMARGAVLPLRFGTQLEREQELEAVLAARRDELLRSLERVRGKVEVGVRVIAPRPSTDAPDDEVTGRDYLLARVQAHRRDRQAIRELHPPLVSLSEASCVRPSPSGRAIFAGAYLVASDRVDEFRRRAAELAGRQAGIRVAVTGPWPPYSFATEEQRCE